MNEFQQLYNLMAYFGINTPQAFYSYYTSVLAPLETTGLDIDGFEWAPTQIDFDYRVWETGNNIDVMATYVDIDSEALPLGGEVELSEYTGTIPTQKMFVTLDQTDYRKKLVFLNNLAASTALSGGNVSVSIREHLEEYLFTKLAEIPNGHKMSLNYQIGQMKSKHALTLTDENNPRGGYQNVTFTAHVPDSNIKTENWMTINPTTGVITYIDGVDPSETIKRKIYDIKHDPKYAYDNVELEMNAKFFWDLMGHPVWKKLIGYMLNPQLLLAGDNKNDKNAATFGANYLLTAGEEAIIAAFKKICNVDNLKLDTAIVGVGKFNTTTKKIERTKLDAFDYGVILFRPTGNIGKIIPVAPLRPDGEAIISSLYGGRGLVEYIYNKNEKVQTWRSELTCLAIPTVPRQLHYLNVVGETPAVGG